MTKIGEGGSASVYRCTLDDDPTFYALKRLDTPDLEQGERFKTEVRILSILDHPNIVKVHLRLTVNSQQCYVMPLYKNSLENELVNIAGNEKKITTVFSSILDGVEHAHSQGVLHRDLKPQNVLMNNETEVVVSDFGLGRLVEAAKTRKTATGESLGTYIYAPPEQWDDLKHVDHRADIYSLGKILHAMFLGRAPLVPDMRSVPPGFAFIINKCTEFDPERRFQKITDLKSAWNSLFDATKRDTELGELEQLTAQLTVPPSPQNSDQLTRFLELVVKYQDDEDVFYKQMMEVHPSCFASLYDKDSQTIRQLIIKFVRFFPTRTWPFSYTDRIADQCQGLFSILPDYEIRAEILKCLLELGIDHNRWHVIGRFSELLQFPKVSTEAVIAHDRLGSVDIRIRQQAAPSVNVAKLPPILRPLFEFGEAS